VPKKVSLAPPEQRTRLVTDSPEFYRSALFQTSDFLWAPIMCSGYDSYTPVTYRNWGDGTHETRVIAEPQTDLDGNPIEVKHYHHFSRVEPAPAGPLQKAYRSCSCPLGPHGFLHYLLNGAYPILDPSGRMLGSEAVQIPDFIACGGGAGSGKTEMAYRVIMRGNPHVPPDKRKPHDISYLQHPMYRALCLRKTGIDQIQLFERMVEFFTRVMDGAGGIDAVRSPQYKIVIRCSGATIMFGHMEDENAWMKYWSHEYQTIYINEATQIASLKGNVAKILQRSRSKYPELRPLVFMDTNPTGPGSGWFRDRFVRVRSALGDEIPWRAVMRDREGRTSIYIHSTVYDNPYTLRTGYDKQLRSHEGSEVERRQLEQGDWDAVEGVFFPSFRARGPIKRCQSVPCACGQCEPAWAQHAVGAGKDFEVNSWWPIGLSLDMGFGHHGVALKWRKRPDGRMHVYGEMARTKVEAYLWGHDLARWVLEDMIRQPELKVLLFLSHDAFAAGDKNQANQLCAGINAALGNSASFIATPEHLKQGQAFWEHIQAQDQLRIVVRHANIRNRVDGWGVCREKMRWRPAHSPYNLYDPAFVQRLQEEGRDEDIEKYRLHVMRAQRPEVLPKLWIDPDRCPQLIRTLGLLESDPDNSEDIVKMDRIEDDIADAFRYACTGDEYMESEEPLKVFVARMIDQMQSRLTAGQRLEMGLAESWAQQQYGRARLTSRSSEDGYDEGPNQPFDIDGFGDIVTIPGEIGW
jgi:hypothetical protein